MADELLRGLSHKTRMEPVSEFVEQVAHDPDGCVACAVDALAARLTTAETDAARNFTRAIRAEARVEAAEQALTEARAELVAFPGFQDANAAGAKRITDAYFARAALACPPQRPEPSGTFGGGYGCPEPHHRREFGPACPPPEEEKP